MGEKDKFLVVISVLEGRRLPRRPKHKVIAEAKFDGELLATDPVDHIENPDITQELAWELDKKSLQQHRLQRTSVKIQCYAYDAQSTLKEMIGYVVLDLRSATTNKQCAKWYPLLHSKYHKSKPEIKLALYLDDDHTPQAGNGNIVKAQSEENLTITEASNLKTLVPVLNEEEGFYQIGPSKKCNEMFILSVTVAYATNLAQLIPSNQPLSSSTYFFYYSLLGNDVTNEAFTDLINTNFPAERASVKLRSSTDALRVFFLNQPGIQFHLCCGDQSLGNCEVSLKSLLKKGSSEIYMRPISLEGAYQLVPPNKTKQQIGNIADNLQPTVGICIVLKREDLILKSPVKGTVGNTNENESSPKTRRSPSPKSSPKLKSKTKYDQLKDKGVRSTSPVATMKESKGKPSNFGENYSDTFEEDDKSKETTSLGEQLVKTAARNSSPTSSPKAKSAGHRVPSPGIAGSSNKMIFPPIALAVPPQSHHFTFSIDLRSIKDTSSTNTQSIFIRYTYPFFGSAAPILTHPPVDVRKGMEVLLPQSFCAFDFACSTKQLQETFQRVPLIVEVWSRDEMNKDYLLGTTRLPIGGVLPADKKQVMCDTGVNGVRQEYSERMYIMKSNVTGEYYGELFVVLMLEDWGPLLQQQVTTTQQSTTNVEYQTSAQSVAGNYQQPQLQQQQPDNAQLSPRQTAEYQAALELEMWKETQENAFEHQLKQKEISYMKALGEEWKKRDTEREVIMQKKVTEYSQLEEQLRKTLTDLEKREKQLAANEHEVMRLKTDLQREHDRKLQELKEASNRHKLDCDHQVQLERMKVRELEELITRHKTEAIEAEKKYKNSDRDFTVYKEQQNNKPEVRLQSEINLLTLEKVELERKLDAVGKSKVHYKQQWGRALKELARLKQKEQDVAKANLRRQQQELEHMRLRYLAAEEKEVVASEKKELEDIKNELNKLKQVEEGRLKITGDSNDIHQLGVKRLNTDLDNSIDDHITRLIEERDTLLRTGVYTSQDKIIAELDRQIRESIAQKNV